jgi:competence protein ComEC
MRGLEGSNPSLKENHSDPLKIAFLDVGQGDSTLVMASPTETMLIDAGPPQAGRDVVLPFLKKEGVQKLKYLVATHYHDDHIGGIAEVMRGNDLILGTDDDVIPTNGVIDRGGTYEESSPIFDEYKKIAQPHRITAHPGDIFDVGEASVEVLATNGALEDGSQIALEPFDENSASIVLLLTYGDFHYLHAADITGGGGDPPYQTIDIETSLASLAGDVDVLRVAHHGSETSTNEAFLEITSPEAAIISVGDGNDYGHPHEEVINRLINDDVEIYQTERGWLDERFNDDVHIMNDTITLTVDDDNWSLE